MKKEIVGLYIIDDFFLFGQQPIYFHTSLADPNIVVVVEIIGLLTPKRGKKITQQVSCGWGVLRLFQQGKLSLLSPPK